MRRIYLYICFVLCAVMANAQDYRDVVYLKNGSVIKGFYKSFFLNDSLRMETLDGSKLVVAADEIVRIAKERTDVYVVHQDEYDESLSRWRPKGYSGSVEWVYGYSSESSQTTSNGVYTTHGYQFNRHLFLGAGMGLETYTRTYGDFKIVPVSSTLSLYGEARWYVTHTRIAPVISCRGGYAVTGFKGAFVSPGVGADFSISPRFGGFVRVMLRWQHFEYYWQTDQSKEPTLQIGNTLFAVFAGGLHF